MLKFLIIPLALTTVTPVLSATPWDSEPVVQRVSYADLNLASPEGRATLQHRIDRAVRMACPDLASTDLREHMSGRRCARDAQKGAQIQLAALQNRKDVQLALAGR